MERFHGVFAFLLVCGPTFVRADNAAGKPAPKAAKPAAKDTSPECTDENTLNVSALNIGCEANASSGGIGGLSSSDEPQWVVLADASVSSLDLSEPAASLGVERDTPFTLTRIRLRKNLATSELQAPAGDRGFARRILAPGIADFSLAGRFEYRPLAFIRCTNCVADNPEERGIHTKVSFGAYGAFEVGETLFSAEQPDSSVFSARAVPLAASAGIVGRLEGRMPNGAAVLGSSTIMFSPYVGYAFRMVGGDLGKGDRERTIGSPSQYMHGVDVGIGVQFGNILLDPKITFISNGTDRDIDGLTGLQFQIGISYVLPWTVLGGEKSPAEKDAETAKKNAEEAKKLAVEKAKAAEQAKQDADARAKRAEAENTSAADLKARLDDQQRALSVQKSLIDDLLRKTGIVPEKPQ